jgi:hypothetical protein
MRLWLNLGNQSSSILLEQEDFIFGAADFAGVDDMLSSKFSPSSRVHFTDSFLKLEWNGLDTFVVVAGVSALQPLMTIARVDTDTVTREC